MPCTSRSLLTFFLLLHYHLFSRSFLAYNNYSISLSHNPNYSLAHFTSSPSPSTAHGHCHNRLTVDVLSKGKIRGVRMIGQMTIRICRQYSLSARMTAISADYSTKSFVISHKARLNNLDDTLVSLVFLWRMTYLKMVCFLNLCTP